MSPNPMQDKCCVFDFQGDRCPYGEICVKGEECAWIKEKIEVGTILISNEERQKLKWIEDNLSTQKEWKKSDYADFYNRDIKFLLSLIKKIIH